MRLQEGATVVTAEGRDVGRLLKLVVDADDREVTHLVIGKGVLLPEDRVVPAAAVDHTGDDDTIVLKSGRSPSSFAPYVETRYRDVGHVGAAGMMPHPAPSVPPMPVQGTGAVRPEPLADGSVSIDIGTPVIGEQGRRVGKVEQVNAADDGSVRSITARRGILWFTRRVIIPIGRIATISGDAIRLTIPADEVWAGPERGPDDLPPHL